MLLVLEVLISGVYIALTRGLLFIYIVSIGKGVEGISIVVGVAALATIGISLALYKRPGFLVKRVWMKFTFMHGLERILFIFIPITQDPLLIALIFAAINSLPTGTFMNLVTYGSLSEEDIKDVTAKRQAAWNVSSMVGFALATLLVAFMPQEGKYFFLFLLGSAIGLLSTLTVALMPMSHLEGMEMPASVEQPEKVFSTSSFFVALLASSSLLAIVWVPYVMDFLKGPDYLAVAMSLAGTSSMTVASLFWRKRSFRTLRSSIGLDAVAPSLALATPIPVIHPILSALSGFTFTGANFVGNFLFAGYNRWLGAIKSSILLILIVSVAQALVSPVSILAAGNFFLIFAMVIVLKLVALLLASTMVPEVAIVSEESARTYSFTMYQTSLTGYQASVELSKDAVVTTLRMAALALVFLSLYIIYRVALLVIF